MLGLAGSASLPGLPFVRLAGREASPKGESTLPAGRREGLSPRPTSSLMSVPCLALQSFSRSLRNRSVLCDSGPVTGTWSAIKACSTSSSLSAVVYKCDSILLSSLGSSFPKLMGWTLSEDRLSGERTAGGGMQCNRDPLVACEFATPREIDGGCPVFPLRGARAEDGADR